jgi:hypothetical protein
MESRLAEDLNDIDGTVDNITALSSYIRMHASQANIVVQVRSVGHTPVSLLA